MTSSESWVVFQSDDKNLNYSRLDWVQEQNTWCTQIAGASVSLTFDYYIANVWATYDPTWQQVPAVSATQDGKSVPIQPPPRTPSMENCDPNAWAQWLVLSSQDELNNHTLKIVAEGASENTPFCLLEVDVKAPVRSGVLAEANAAGSNGTATSSTTQTSSSTPSSTSPPSSSASRALSTGAIVGVVIGAVSLTFLICGALFYWYRRHRKHQYTPTDLDDDGSSIRKSPSARPLHLPKLFPRWKPTEPGWIETRPPVSLLPHIRRNSSPTPPLHVSDDSRRSSMERTESSMSEHTVGLSELGLALARDLRDERPNLDAPPLHRASRTVGEVASPVSSQATPSLHSPTS
ncbi:hypothetical protein K466DRAFT_50321 [Polyporus arcularius HHB13444]|uniref:Mid2 domain-containing protein n=1 Tax=Polyporus arcularius HHB13444 TaxID=1314778 RepID=A0A5C3PI75_9APHY|nr:hypothetical protein K466DRAFT_50321 [Polyporus arcularius HHB13444]